MTPINRYGCYSNQAFETTTTVMATIVRYDYIFIRDSCWMRWFFAAIYLSSNLISAICFVLLIRFYFSKKYHKVHEKNLNSTCLSLLAINVLKWANFFWKNHYVNETLIQMNVITTFLLLTAATDLYLTLKSVIKDILVEEAASRRRFAVYSICGWLLPAVVLRAGGALFTSQYFQCDSVFALVQLHCCLNIIAVVLVHIALRSYYPSTWGEIENVQGYKYYSDEKHTSNIVRILSSMRFVFHLSFLVSRKHVVLSILDFFRAYEGMYIYYYLIVTRRNKCRCEQTIGLHVQSQSGASSSV